MNNEDKKLKNIMKKAYEDASPSAKLQSRIMDSYEQNQKSDVTTSKIDNKKRQFKNLFQIKYFAVTGAVLSIIIGIIFVTTKGNNNQVVMDEIEQLTNEVNEYLAQEDEDVLDGVENDIETLAIISGSDDVQNGVENKNQDDSVVIDTVSVEEALNSLENIDEIESILDEDIFDDEIFS